MTTFGIDLGIRKVAVSVITQGLDGYTCYGVPRLVLPKQTRTQELYKIASYVQALVHTYEPDHVFIEKPIVGNNHKYSMQLSEVCGAVMSMMGKFDAGGTKVVIVDNKTWKRELLMNGNASKDDVRNYINEVHPVYAAFCGDDQDAYDACCIALYGVTILDRAKELSL